MCRVWWESRVDDAVAGVEEDFGGGEGFEVGGGGGEDAVVEVVVAGVVAGEATGNGGGPEDVASVVGRARSRGQVPRR